ncbi:hypothetical protein [Marinobacter sp. F4216]|uniref:hypothetical protein n=1 Tax=Marinobacter sp. F4216 TaxID=2874281 RepID=UPI001CBAA311|nr:hypothetical protein [Marinobacter sp. F4216]MBZ2167554.1 hypothetical protein [Marinobacter sp. F4216]
MFKELWRKLGNDITTPECGTPDFENSCSFGDGGQCSDGFNIWPHITHTGEFHLERLTALLKTRYGKTYAPERRQGSNQAIRELIGYAARIQDQDVQRELLLFYLNCSPAVQEFLRSETMLGKGPLFPR